MAKSRFNISVDEEVHREFKATCAMMGMAVSEMLQSQMEKVNTAYNKIKNNGNV